MTKINKSFPGLQALKDVDFDLKPAEVHALIGINGAGKSTLIKILSGVYQKDSGEISIDGERVSIRNTQQAIKSGIATVYQHPELVQSFTGYENIYLGAETEKGKWYSRINDKKLKAKASLLLEQFPVAIDLQKSVCEMGPVDQEVTAILTALSRRMKILILDEPTSILTEKEKEDLFALINLLKSRGVSIIYISHRLEEIDIIADRLTILRDGIRVSTLDLKKKGEYDHLEIAQMMLGKKLENLYPEKSHDIGEELLSAKGLSLEGHYQDVNFSLRQGEILGIFGLVGSGTAHLSKTLFGAVPASEGKLFLKNEEVVFKSPRDAIKKGIFLIPGNRKLEGLTGDEPISFNISLANLKKVSFISEFVNKKEENEIVTKLCKLLNVATDNPAASANTLSGGNQQKVVFAKGIFTDANIYIIHEPTVGVDVGSKVGIYQIIRELTRTGAVIIVSTDCEEVYGMCDQVMALYKGQTILNRSVTDTNRRELLLCGIKGNPNS